MKPQKKVKGQKSEVKSWKSADGRRGFLKTVAIGTAGAALYPLTIHGGAGRSTGGTVPFRLGVATYSLRAFSRAEAIEIIKALKVSTASIKSFHLPYDVTAGELAAAADQFRAAGIEPVSCGVVYFEEDTDEHVRKYFDYARNAGIPMIVMAAAPEILPRIERFVKSYDIPVAIHNHGPEDEYYPAPADALKVIEGMDPRVGVCVDVGHTARTGTDVVEALADAGSRLLDIHMKDYADLMDKETQVPVGEGGMPVAAMFDQLSKMKYAGSVNLEYEIDKDDPLPGMMQSMAYMRGVVAGLERA